MSNVYPFELSRTKSAGTAGTASGMEYEQQPLTRRMIERLEQRGLDVEMLVRLGVGASAMLRDGDAIAIPYWLGEACVGVKHRTLTAEPKRVLQTKGSAQIFYNANVLIDDSLKNYPLVITEGELDAWTAMQHGYLRVLSVPNGAPSQEIKPGDERIKYGYLEELLNGKYFEGITEVILAVDSDGPGRLLRDDLARRIGHWRCKTVRYPEGCKDLNDTLENFGQFGVKTAMLSAQPMRLDGVYSFDEIPEPAPNPAYKIGMISLERHYNIRLGDFCVVTGIPGSGKTSFVNEVCARMAKNHGFVSVFASFEDPFKPEKRRWLRTFHSERLEVMMTQSEIDAADAWIKDHFIAIIQDENDDADIDLAWMIEKIKNAVLRHGAHIVVVDPWNEMDHLRAPDQSQTEYVGFAIKRLKRLARRLNFHLIICAHPAKMQRMKDGKYPMPSAYDIADSAHWANKPDVVVIVHREDITKNDAILRIAKARYADIGRPGEIDAIWSRETSRYIITDMSDDYTNPENATPHH